jgi:hypothetical protein
MQTTAEVSSDLQLLLGKKIARVPVTVAGKEHKFSIPDMAALVGRFKDDRGFVVLMGCLKCETACFAPFDEHHAAYCGCCSQTGKMNTQHAPLTRVATLLKVFQDRGHLPNDLFDQATLDERLSLLTEVEFRENVQRNELVMREIASGLPPPRMDAASLSPQTAA